MRDNEIEADRDCQNPDNTELDPMRCPEREVDLVVQAYLRLDEAFSILAVILLVIQPFDNHVDQAHGREYAPRRV